MSNRRALARTLGVPPVALLLTLVLGASFGCATRLVRHPVIERGDVEVDLVRHVRGFSVEERAYEHPAILSVPRLVNILGAIEVELRTDDGSTLRQPAFHAEIVQAAAEALSAGLRAASKDEEVGVKLIRKERRLGVFHRKHLTSFLARVENEQLYLAIRRVDWPIPRRQETKPLPEPARDRRDMDFRVVSGEPIYFAGVQDLEIDWRHDAFRQAFRLPGSTEGRRVRREVLESSPVPKAELEESAPDGLRLDELTPEQLRALADLEEERRAGRITETAYQRARRELMRAR